MKDRVEIAMTMLVRTPPPGRRHPLTRRARAAGKAGLYAAVVALACIGNLLPLQATAQPLELAPALQRLATCEDSWHDTHQDSARRRAIDDALHAQFRMEDRSPVWKPISPLTWLGVEVLEITPRNVGMGQGFAVKFKQPVGTVQPAYEQALGKALTRCELDSGLLSCERQIADKRTAILIAPLAQPERGTLVGCFYF